MGGFALSCRLGSVGGVESGELGALHCPLGQGVLMG